MGWELEKISEDLLDLLENMPYLIQPEITKIFKSDKAEVLKSLLLRGIVRREIPILDIFLMKEVISYLQVGTAFSSVDFLAAAKIVVRENPDKACALLVEMQGSPRKILSDILKSYL